MCSCPARSCSFCHSVASWNGNYNRFVVDTQCGQQPIEGDTISAAADSVCRVSFLPIQSVAELCGVPRIANSKANGEFLASTIIRLIWYSIYRSGFSPVSARASSIADARFDLQLVEQCQRRSGPRSCVVSHWCEMQQSDILRNGRVRRDRESKRNTAWPRFKLLFIRQRFAVDWRYDMTHLHIIRMYNVVSQSDNLIIAAAYSCFVRCWRCCSTVFHAKKFVVLQLRRPQRTEKIERSADNDTIL